MDNSGIEWTDATWNPIRGCSKVSAGCANCYAEKMAARFSGPGLPYEGLIEGGRWNGQVKFIPEQLDQPMRWKRPRRIFVNSMSDLFHEQLDFKQIAVIFAVMAAAPQHTFQVLTKRPEQMLKFFEWMKQANAEGALSPQRKMTITAQVYMLGKAPAIAVTDNAPWPLPNVWLGVSVEDQKTADQRIPLLLSAPAAVRWISAEPMVGPINLRWAPWHSWGRTPGFVNDQFDGVRRLDWIVTGGESGVGARAAPAAWYRVLRDHATAAGVPFFFKQWGEYVPPSQMPAETAMALQDHGHGLGITDNPVRVGKHCAGRLLDGRTWDEYPQKAGSR